MGRSKKSTGNWLMTYSDLVTLLLVFFVLLYMLTPGIDESIFDNFISYFQQSVGVIDQTSVMSNESSNRSDVYRVEIMEKWEVVEEFIEQHGVTSQVEIAHIPDGVKITLSDSLTFESGSSELLPMAELVLEKVAEVFDNDIEQVESQGHTDNVPIAASSYYRSNWHLGAARAVSVIEFIQSKTVLDPSRFKASSFGEYKPVTTNETAEGRRQNRRVEIYIRYRDLLQPDELPMAFWHYPAETGE